MKPFLTILILLVSALTFAQPSSTLNLKLPGDLFYTRNPGNNKSLSMTLLDKIPSVMLVATDNSASDRLEKGKAFKHGKGKRANLLAFPVIYKVSAQGSDLVVFFGEKGAENDFDQSVVRVSYRNAPSSSGKNMNRQPLKFPVSASEILTVPVSGVPEGEVGTRQFLSVEATSARTATIEIDREAHRGNVLVGIFSQKNGNLLATLNPKDPDNSTPTLSFTIDEPVLILPVIRPRVTTSGNSETVVFEVGDPREVATVTISEE